MKFSFSLKISVILFSLVQSELNILRSSYMYVHTYICNPTTFIRIIFSFIISVNEDISGGQNSYMQVQFKVHDTNYLQLCSSSFAGAQTFGFPRVITRRQDRKRHWHSGTRTFCLYFVVRHWEHVYQYSTYRGAMATIFKTNPKKNHLPRDIP